MAINVNTVYQKVLALANKEQRGYITPQEFNLLADKAQNEIYENYFHKARTSNAKIKDDDQYTDTLEMIEAKLAPFFKSESNTNVTSGVMTFPTDMYKLIAITQGTVLLEEVNRKEFLQISGSGDGVGLLSAYSTRPIFHRKSGTTITISPSPSNGTGHVVNYYKQPTAPKWDYVVVNEKALYNSNTSVDFELTVSEEEPLVLRILMLAGLTIQRPDVIQAGGQGLQMINQEQNS